MTTDVVIGLNSLGHDTAAAVVENGKLVFAIEEERINREKHTRKLPVGAVRECLKFLGAEINDVDVISVGLLPVRYVKHKFLGYIGNTFPDTSKLMVEEMDKVRSMISHEQSLRESLNYNGIVQFHSHHLCHLASSFYLSNFDEAALYSIDGFGEIESSVLGYGANSSISVFDDDSIRFPVSIGLLYAAITFYLGFRPMHDEGKVMGLAPYGNPTPFRGLFESIVKFEDRGKYDFDLSFLSYPFERDIWVSQKFLEKGGPRRLRDEALEQRHKDIAASLQEITEKAMLHTSRYLKAKTGAKNLSLAGGVALNCVANGKVLQRSGFENIFIQPAAGDNGVSIGAAFVAHYQTNPRAPRLKYPLCAYWGPEFNDEEIRTTINDYGLDYQEMDDLTLVVATKLANGKVVSWFNGRMEFGPRALGNRSILANPTSTAYRDLVNVKVKEREDWRPFAPALLYEFREKYLVGAMEAPFMAVMDLVRPEVVEKIPAVVHVDQSTRPQTVRSDQNPNFHKLLVEFHKLTGVPALLNTSQNRGFEPVVMSPKDAIECFLGTAIDVLALNNRFLILKTT